MAAVLGSMINTRDRLSSAIKRNIEASKRFCKCIFILYLIYIIFILYLYYIFILYLYQFINII
jgi:hypothetical protein